MEIESVMSVIGSVGFPIFACCAMGWFMFSSFEEFRKTIERNNALLSHFIDYVKVKDKEEVTDDKKA